MGSFLLRSSNALVPIGVLDDVLFCVDSILRAGLIATTGALIGGLAALKSGSSVRQQFFMRARVSAQLFTSALHA